MGVAFLDVGVYVASLRTVKNLLVISDIVKSVWLVAFQVSTFQAQRAFCLNLYLQEDPYKLSILGKDPHPRALTCADFFFANGLLSILTCDEEGVIRIFDYNPHGTCVSRGNSEGANARTRSGIQDGSTFALSFRVPR